MYLTRCLLPLLSAVWLNDLSGWNSWEWYRSLWGWIGWYFISHKNIVTWNFQMDAFEVISFSFSFVFAFFFVSIQFYNGNPINLRYPYPLLQCLGRTQSMDQQASGWADEGSWKGSCVGFHRQRGVEFLFGNMWASWKKEPRNGCLGFIFSFRGWNPSQLCGKYFINHYKDPY